jgi:hypothetical protein
MAETVPISHVVFAYRTQFTAALAVRVLRLLTIASYAELWEMLDYKVKFDYTDVKFTNVQLLKLSEGDTKKNFITSEPRSTPPAFRFFSQYTVLHNETYV